MTDNKDPQITPVIMQECAKSFHNNFAKYKYERVDDAFEGGFHAGVKWATEQFSAEHRKLQEELKQLRAERVGLLEWIDSESIHAGYQPAYYSGLLKCKSKLTDSAQPYKDDYPPISIKSVRNFCSWIFNQRNNIPKPTIFITNDKCIRAEWQIEKGEFLGVEFLDDGQFDVVTSLPKWGRKICDTASLSLVIKDCGFMIKDKLTDSAENEKEGMGGE